MLGFQLVGLVPFWFGYSSMPDAGGVIPCLHLPLRALPLAAQGHLLRIASAIFYQYSSRRQLNVMSAICFQCTNMTFIEYLPKCQIQRAADRVSFCSSSESF